MADVGSARPVGCPFPFQPAADPLAPAPVPVGYEDQQIIKVSLPAGQDDTWAWWVRDYTAVEQVYRDDRTFRRGNADGILPYLRLAPLILTMDGEHHRRLRKVVNREFTRPRVERCRPTIEALASNCVDNLLGAGQPADLTDHLSWPLSLTAIAELLGAPVEGRDQFMGWGDRLLSTGPDRESENRSAMAEMTAYAAQLMAQRRADPAGDVLSVSIDNAEELGVDPMEAAMLIASLIVAGWETTAAAISATVFALLTLPGDDGDSLYSQLCARPDRIPNAVEEMLRLVPNSWYDSGQPRRAACDVELAGVHIKAGDLVFSAHDHANRDAQVFDDPERVNLDRATNPHLSFGSGAHFCLGAHLARLELNVALEQLTRRVPTLRLAVPADDVEWNRDTPIRRPAALPVAWSAVSG